MDQEILALLRAVRDGRIRNCDRACNIIEDACLSVLKYHGEQRRVILSAITESIKGCRNTLRRDD